LQISAPYEVRDASKHAHSTNENASKRGITSPQAESMLASQWKVQTLVNKRKRQDDDISSTTRDKFDIYGEHVANELRNLKDTKFSLILAQTKRKINVVLYEAELCRINVDSQI